MDLSSVFVHDPVIRKYIILENLSTCGFTSLMLLYMKYTGLLYKIADNENSLTIYMIAAFEIAKYFFFRTSRKGKRLKTRNSFQEALRSIILLGGATMIFYIAAVLFGAPLISMWNRTLVFAVLLTFLIVLPLCLNCGLDETIVLLASLNFHHLASEHSNRFLLNLKLTLFGAWLGAVVIPLDWDKPWQVWPIPCCVGAIVGYLVANIICLCIQLTSSINKTGRNSLNL